MDKLYPNKIVFNNNNAPALNASNLNAMSQAIADIDERVIKGYAQAIVAGSNVEEAKEAAIEAQMSAQSAKINSALTASDREQTAKDVATTTQNVESAQASAQTATEQAQIATDAAVEAASQAVNEVKGELQSYVDMAQDIANLGIIAELWSSTAIYKKDDYAVHNGKLWKALADNAHSEPVEGATWVEVKVADELGSGDVSSITKYIWKKDFYDTEMVFQESSEEETTIPLAHWTGEKSEVYSSGGFSSLIGYYVYTFIKAEGTAAKIYSQDYTALTTTNRDNGTIYQIVFDNGKTESYLNSKKLSDISDVISDEWDGRKSYVAGDYCIYRNQLWKCLVANSGIDPTEGTHWTLTNVVKLLAEIGGGNDKNHTSNEMIVGYVGNKPIYRATWPIYGKITTSTSVSLNATITTSISALAPNYNHILNYGYRIQDALSGNTQNTSYNNNVSVTVDIPANKISIKNNQISNFWSLNAKYPSYIWIEYTKTTD